MNDDENYQKLKDYAFRLLSFRPRSKKEIRDKLNQYSTKHKLDSASVVKVLKELESGNFINDQEFAKWWLDQRQSFKPKGLKAIKFELFNKGVEKEVIEKVISDAKDRDNEFVLAQKVVSKKINLWRDLSKLDKKRKVSNLLARRGFDWETVKRVIDATVSKD